MATRRPSLPSARELSVYSGPEHPVISAVQFSEALRNTGGATMNVHTNRIEPVGEKGTGYAVGKAPDMRTGQPVQTAYEPARRGRRTTNSEGAPATDMSVRTVLSHRDRIRATGRMDPNRAMGAWDARHDEPARAAVDMDASQVFHDRDAAMRAGAARGESAIFDLHAGEDIRMDPSTIHRKGM